MIIGFTGTRKGMSDNQKTQFVYLLSNFVGPLILSHGDAEGADKEADELFIGRLLLGRFIRVHPPLNPIQRAYCGYIPGSQGKERIATDYANYYYEISNPKPFKERDIDIVNECGLLIAAPLDENKEEIRSGTWQTVRYARKIKKPYILLPR